MDCPSVGLSIEIDGAGLATISKSKFDIGAVRGKLVNFHGHNVGARDQQGRIDSTEKKDRPVILRDTGRQRGGGDGTGGHIAPKRLPHHSDRPPPHHRA